MSPHDADEVYVVVNDYRRNDWQPYLYRTTDAGESWVRLVLEGGEVTGHVLSVVQDPEVPSLLFLGTEEGLFVSFDRGANWKRWTHEVPSVPVRDMVIHPRDGDLVLGTFGRAAYVIDDLAPLRDLAAEGNGLMEENLRVFAIPDAYQVNFRRHAGARFPADHFWSGENYGGGARVQFYVHPDTAAAYGEDDLKWSVLKANGDTLRNGAMTADGGIQTMRWRFDTNGMDWPSRQLKKKKDTPSGGGPDVLPGTYTLAMALGDHTGSAEVTVHPDPRVPYDRQAHEARNLHQRIAMEAAKPIAEGMNEIQRMVATIETVQGDLKWIPDSLKEEANALTDSLTGELARVEELYYEPKDFKGIESVTERLSSVMWTAFSVNGGAEAPGGNAQRALERLHTEGAAFAEEVRVIQEGLWKEWLAAVEAIDRSPARLYEGTQKD